MKKTITSDEKSRMIREIQLVNLKSLKKLDEICRRHHIFYWAAYGTLIGAIRHQGFIPWDDDLDVCMMREDYERLCKVPKEEWGEDCLLLTGFSDDPRHDKLFARVYQKNTRIQSYKDVKYWRGDDHKAWSTSLMCDIYVFDHVPDDDKIQQRLYKKIFKMATRKYKISKLWYVADGGTLREKVSAWTKRAEGRFLRLIYKKPWRHYALLYEKYAGSVKPGRRIGTYSTSDPYLYLYEEVFPLQYARFEDMEVPIPQCYDKMLTDMYGDYMTFPPEKDRYHINFIYADLGDGRKYVIDPVPGSLGAIQ